MSTASRVQAPFLRRKLSRAIGFTLVELLVVIAIIAILVSLLLPVMNTAKAKAQGVFCMNNTRQLCIAWELYADDHSGRFPYNLGGSTGNRKIAPRTQFNWVNNTLDWFATPGSDNTNPATILQASLSDYAARSLAIYKCPSDKVVSSAQADAGWTGRVRSYSMNAMVGDAGPVSLTGVNQNNPDYVQFFSASQIPEPSRIFVFLDEHPDSINDGYFLEQADYTTADGGAVWIDLPASYHNGAASLSFADGHAEIHRWLRARTKRPPIANSLRLPMYIPANEREDYDWVISHMSVDKD